ncbi:MAG: hypothetical protein K8W52_29135 [Deltaproteobacteria bacterium]|nr:hypothetical protein [Deltaproteobacteria bacterium]
MADSADDVATVTAAVEAAIAAVERALAGASPAPSDTPWLSWLVVCLGRQRHRQRWHLEVQRTHLGGARRGRGEVPGLPGWRYRYHGIGLCLEGPDGEVLDVDFHDPEGDTLETWFFGRRIESLGPRFAPEARLRTWLPTNALLTAAIDNLRTAGVISHPRSRNVFLLGPRLAAIAEAIGALDLDGEVLARTWDAHLGAAPASAAFERWIVGVLTSRARATSVLEALVGLLPRDRAIALITPFVDGPIDLATAAAVRALDTLDASAAEIDAVLPRLDPETDHTGAGVAVASYLLRRDPAHRGARDAVIAFGTLDAAPGRTGNPYVEDFAMLALEFVPDRALALVRRTLREQFGGHEVAALLAILDEPWAEHELRAAIADAPAKADLAAALARRGTDLALHRAATSATPTDDDDDDDAWFACAAARLAPLAARLRGVRVC